MFSGLGEEYLLDTVEMYSPQTETFVMMATMKLARCYFASCRVGNLVFIIGGSNMKRETSSVEVYIFIIIQINSLALQFL